ncbi:MAG: hypothetical protein ACKODH_12500, partial [Limisphaerales bacterium]
TLPHRQYVTNLMSSGNSAAWLNEAEIKQAREAAKQKSWSESAAAVRERAEAAERSQITKDTRRLWQQLEHIPLEGEAARLARHRAKEPAK